MKPYIASSINAVLLISMSSWGYLASATPSPTALIPAGIGVALLIMVPGVRKENKVIAHIAVVLTLVVLAGLVMPLKGAIGRGSAMGTMRVSLMLISTIVAMVFFVKSFIDARKKRQAAGN
ncbi:MAG: hypothetical protein ACFB10_03320 [Salibacteraceae bacterium]